MDHFLQNDLSFNRSLMTRLNIEAMYYYQLLAEQKQGETNNVR